MTFFPFELKAIYLSYISLLNLHTCTISCLFSPVTVLVPHLSSLSLTGLQYPVSPEVYTYDVDL